MPAPWDQGKPHDEPFLGNFLAPIDPITRHENSITARQRNDFRKSQSSESDSKRNRASRLRLAKGSLTPKLRMEERAYGTLVRIKIRIGMFILYSKGQNTSISGANMGIQAQCSYIEQHLCTIILFLIVQIT